MRRLLTAKDVSISLNLPLQRVYELTRRKAIPAVRLFRQYRYDPAALDEWAKGGGTAQTNAREQSEVRDGIR